MNTKVLAMTIIAGMALAAAGMWISDPADATSAPDLAFTAFTPAIECGVCHQEIYQEFTQGAGRTSPGTGGPQDGAAFSAAGSGPTAHARAKTDTGGLDCAPCHYPETLPVPSADVATMDLPAMRPAGHRQDGVTCVSCHLTPQGAIRSVRDVAAPHAVVAAPELSTSRMCAYCHSRGAALPGARQKTYFEWRDDFAASPGGGRQCQDCHMPHMTRQTAEDSGPAARTTARHVWLGGQAKVKTDRVAGLSVELAPGPGPGFAFRVANLAAGHSLPTGAPRRALRLRVRVLGDAGQVLAEREWLFAPWAFDRPDDKAHLEEDKALPPLVAKNALAADAQGPHETALRAGETRRLEWFPELNSAWRAVEASLAYDPNRYDPRPPDETRLAVASLAADVQGSPFADKPPHVRELLDAAFTLRQGVDAAAWRRAWPDLAYAASSPSQKLDLYLPDAGKGPFPVVVAIHGGSFVTGDKRDFQIVPMLAATKRGYAVAAVNYRLAGEAKFPAQIYDVKAAIRFIRANAKRYGLDPARIAVWGDSAGGNLAALAAVTGGTGELEDVRMGNPERSSAVSAAVDWYGPVDFLAMGDAARAQPKPNPLFGVSAATSPDVFRQANPETYIRPGFAPILIQHGDADRVIAVSQSAHFAAKLGEMQDGGRATLDLIPGADHLDERFASPENVAKVLDFLDRHLK